MASFEISFFSQSLNRSVRCKALLPTDQGAYLEMPAKPPLKTLYLLHGMTGSQDTWAETATSFGIAAQVNMICGSGMTASGRRWISCRWRNWNLLQAARP